MITWDETQTMLQEMTADTSSGSLTTLKRYANLGYHAVLADLGRVISEKTQTALTVANQQYYQMPSNTLFIKSITVTVGSIPYPLEEIPDQETWDALNADLTSSSDIPTYFFVRPGFGINGTEIGIFPKPASASNTITVVYEAGDRDLTNDAYTTGTVTLANGSATVTGSGTTFTPAMVGRYFKGTVDGVWYRIVTYTSATVIVLENVFEGTAGAGLAYTINEAFNLPEDLHILPIYFALSHYYDIKQDTNRSIKFLGMFEQGMMKAKKRYGSKTRGAIVRGKPKFQFRGNNYPPGTIT
jgi:hypothetical protein